MFTVNGNQVRRIKASTGNLTLRRDSSCDDCLIYLRGTLAGVIPGDVPSHSMLVRRALQFYRSEVERLAKVHDLGREMARVREGSRLPVIHKPFTGQ